MKVWVFLDGRQQGPFEESDLATLPGFSENTKVWFEGLPKWYAAGTLPQLQHLFAPQQQESVEETVAIIEEPPAKPADACRTDSQAEEPVQSSSPLSPFADRVNSIMRDPSEPAARQAAVMNEPCPPTYVGWSIFLFLCCCSPVSVAALAASICVTVFYGKGKLDKARKASEITAWLVMISIALGMLPVMLMSAMLG